MKRSIRIAENVAHSDSFSVCVFGIEIDNELRRLTKEENETARPVRF